MNLRKGRARDVEGEVLHTADLAWGRATGVLPRFVREHRQQAPVAGIEVEVVLVGPSQIGLLEDEGHPKDSLPEVHRALLRRTHDRDVMHTLDLDLLHARTLGQCHTNLRP
jgi:hypothetical protein